MSTDITKLPNEVSQNNNVVMNVTDSTSRTGSKTSNKKISSPSEPLPAQLSQESIHQIVQGLQQAGGSTSLPNRDIHMNSDHITQDEEIKANYIPQPGNDNYIEEAADMDSLIQQNKNKKVEQDRLDILYNEVQTPLLVMILFFFFQLPYFNKILVRYLPAVFSRDGNPTFSGYLIKTLVFGISFYAITQITKQLSEI